MHKRYLVKLDKDERKELAELVKKEKVAAKKRTHAQVLLLADCGKQGSAWKDEAIAQACQVTVKTVENIRKRLVLEVGPQPQAAGPSVANEDSGRGKGSQGRRHLLRLRAAGARPLDLAVAGGTGRRIGNRRIRVARNRAPLS